MTGKRLDPRPIMAALGLPATARATPVTGGADTSLWRIDRGGQAFALRVLQPGQSGRGLAEAAAMTAAAEAGVPVPRIITTAEWQERPVLLLSWSPGQTLAAALLRDPARAWHLGRAFGRTQATIHAIPAPPDLEDAAASWLDWAPPDAALRGQLESLATASGVLVHLDYHPLNVLIEDGQVSAVIDWANARGGDPRADLARTAAILRFLPIERQMPAPTAAAVRRALTAGWRSGYQEIAGPVADLAPFFAWAGAAMITDLSPRLGRPDLPWLTTAYLDRVQQWTTDWRRRAGLAGL